MEKINLGIIGTGGRSTAYADQCISGMRENVCIKAMADINTEKLKGYSLKYFPDNDGPNLYGDFKEMLDKEDIDAVIICTPDWTHKSIAIYSLERGMHVLLEKPIATTIEDSIEIYRESLKRNKVFKLGFVLRYTPFYRKIKQLVADGELGKIITVEAKETLGYIHAGSFFRRWHCFKKNNGGFLNAKCSHDMDILNWIIDAKPSYVSAFGSRTYFNERQGAAMNCKDCDFINSCRYAYKAKEYEGIHSQFQASEGTCVFNSEKDIVDHEVVIIEYENNITASFTVSMLSAEANRTMTIFGTEATLAADFSKGTIDIKYILPKNEMTLKIDSTEAGHGGGDQNILVDFIDLIRRNDTGSASNDGKAGMMSSLIALAAEKCLENRETINLSYVVMNE